MPIPKKPNPNFAGIEGFIPRLCRKTHNHEKMGPKITIRIALTDCHHSAGIVQLLTLSGLSCFLAKKFRELPACSNPIQNTQLRASSMIRTYICCRTICCSRKATNKRYNPMAPKQA